MTNVENKNFIESKPSGEEKLNPENTYEVVELVVRNPEKMKLDKTPPEPPPRNIILKPVKSNIYRWRVFVYV